MKTPTHLAPQAAAAAVAAHESEHVNREQGKTQRTGRKVVQQTVSYQTAICPECGRIYVSGGTTRTVTAADDTGRNDRWNRFGRPDKGGFVEMTA